MAEESDDMWYVAIARFIGGNHYSITAAGSSFYRNFAETSRKQGIKMIAEEFNVPDKKLSQIEGFDDDGRKIGESGLDILVERINSGEGLDAKEELHRLVGAA